MGGYAVFLAPIAGIMAADFWLVKSQNIDVPALYDPAGRYRYIGGCNWRAAAAFLVAVGPNLPGLAYSINPAGTHINDGIKNLYTFDWLFGFLVSIVLYTAFSRLFPAKETLSETTIYGHEMDDSNKLSDKERPREVNPETDLRNRQENFAGDDFGNVDTVNIEQGVYYLHPQKS